MTKLEELIEKLCCDGGEYKMLGDAATIPEVAGCCLKK